MAKKRCTWCGTDNSLMEKYHDAEWGVPLHRDKKLFEFLTLEGAQAGLSWDTILKKRANYRRAFDNFDPAKVARYTERKQQQLLKDPGIVRNRLKVASTVSNASAFLAVQKEFGSFNRYIWSFVDGKPRQNSYRNSMQLPRSTEEASAMSKDLKKREFRFVGPTICYAFMQATGMVNDHSTDCFRHKEVKKLSG